MRHPEKRKSLVLARCSRKQTETQQFETDDVSLSELIRYQIAQIKLLHNLNLVRLVSKIL